MNDERASGSRTDPPDEGAPPRSVLERALGLFTRVEAGEGVTALLLTTQIFMLLAGYYLLKVAREGLVLVHVGAEGKTYAAAGQAVLLLLVVRAVDALARRFGRIVLMTASSLFFASNLVLFFVAVRAGAHIGVAFYVWVGVFNVTVIAQAWGFAADLYTEAQGKRLFAIIGIGSGLGALAGSQIAKKILQAVGTHALLLVAAGVVVACWLLTLFIHRREGGRSTAITKEPPLGGESGIRLVLADRYLLFAAALTLILNSVNTIGEYLLDRTLIASVTTGTESIGKAIGAFKADFYFDINLLSLGLQLFVVSRFFKYAGVRAALFVLPVIAFGGYALAAITPRLSLLAPVKTIENSLDYSLQNTARQALFLPLARAAKYKAKAVIDGFLVRVGDVVAALLVWAGAQAGFGVRSFALLNVGLTLVWLAIVVGLAREHRRRTATEAPAEAATEAPAP